MLSSMFIAALQSQKANLLALLSVMFSCVFDNFPCGVLGQLCYMYLIVSIPELCNLCYFVKLFQFLDVNHNDIVYDGQTRPATIVDCCFH